MCTHSRGGHYTGINVTTSIMLCHDMDFAIPWVPLHIHGFHWMDRQQVRPKVPSPEPSPRTARQIRIISILFIICKCELVK